MRRRIALKIVAMEAGGGVGGGVGGLGLSERERGSVFKQMGEMKKKIQVRIGHYKGRNAGQCHCD